MFEFQNMLNIILFIPGVLLAFTFHEYAHALVAYKLGDNTPKFQGRLTFNPIAHIDPIGFIMLLVFKFGWAKPVQTNPSAFKNYYKDDLKVSVAGVIGNLFAALLSTILLGILFKIPFNNANLTDVLSKVFVYSIQINCLLFVLNLLPLPGFDGAHILRDIFPKFFHNIEDKLYRYQMIILAIFILPILPGRNTIIGLILDGPTNILTNKFIELLQIFL